MPPTPLVRPSLNNLRTVTFSNTIAPKIDAELIAVSDKIESSNVITSTSTITGGNVSSLGNLDVSGFANIGQKIKGLSSLEINDATNLHGTLTVDSATSLNGPLTVNAPTNVLAPTTLHNSLNVFGPSTIGSTLGVSGPSTLNNTLNVMGPSTLNNTLNVSGATQLQSSLGVSGASTLNNTLNVSGATTLQSTLNVSGNSSLNGTLSVNGDSHLSSNIDIDGFINASNSLLYVNSVYVNDNIKSLQTGIDEVGSRQGVVVNVSPGSYADENIVINGKINMGVLAQIPGGTLITEIGTAGTPRNLTISGATSTRVKMSGFNIKGLTTIDGTLGRHYFYKNEFNGGLTFTGSTSNFCVFQDCDIVSTLTIPNTFAGVIYFVRCAFNGSAITLNNPSPLQIIFTDCNGFLTFPTQCTLTGTNYLTSGFSKTFVTEASLAGSLNVVGPSTLIGPVNMMNGSTMSTLTVAGTSNLNGSVSMLNNASVGGTLNVTGASTLNGPSTMNSSLSVSGPTTLVNTLNAIGAVNMANNATVSGTLTAHTIVSNNISDILNLSTANIGSTNLYTEINRLRTAIQHSVGNGDLIIGDLDTSNIYIGAPTSSNAQTIYIGNANDNIIIQGSTTQVTTTNSTVSDAVITLNKGGLNHIGSGIEIEANGSVVSSLLLASSGNVVITDYNGRAVDVANVANGNFPNLYVSGVSTMDNAVTIHSTLSVDGNVSTSSNVTVSDTVHSNDIVVGNGVVTTKDSTYAFRVNGDIHVGMDGVYDNNQFGALTITTNDTQAENNKSSIAFVREGNYVWQMGYMNNSNDFYIYDGDIGLKLTATNSQSWSTPSDIRIKKNVETIDNSLDRVMKMRGVYYNYNTDAEDSPRKVGVIAQETLEALPELVDVPSEEDKYLTVRYSEISCLLINAIKELKQENDTLKSRIELLEQK